MRDQSQPARLIAHRIHKTFPGCRAVQNASLTAYAGEIVALLGPSGCGKTTFLRLIAGFEFPDAGVIQINDRLVANETVRIPAEARRVGMVFQDYALFPHLTVAGNVAFGVKGSSSEKTGRVEELLRLVGLSDLGARMPYELSGGQQQRVALARALAPRPEILLLDEPFSNLDAALRAEVRGEIRTILKATGVTCIFVTHDQQEALSLADAVAVMIQGQIVQADTPERLYHLPANREVASFVGEANFVRGEAAGKTVTCVLGVLPLENHQQGKVEALIRPENVRLVPDSHSPLKIVWREFYGHDQRVGIALPDGSKLVARLDTHHLVSPGQSVRVEVMGAVRAFPA